MSNLMIDVSRKQLTYLDSRYYFDEEGNYLPSVTTILSAYPKGPEYYMWLKKVGMDADDIRDDAGKRGSTVHHLTELYDAGEEVSLFNDLGGMRFSQSEWSMFRKYTEFSEKFPHKILLMEQTIMCSSLGFAGTIDRIIEINGKKLLIDIKTSSSIWESYWLQLAAYRKMYEKEIGGTVDGSAILWLNAKTRGESKKGAIQGEGWQLVIRDEKESHVDWELFCHTFILWGKQNGDDRPRNLTYKTSYKKTI